MRFYSAPSFIRCFKKLEPNVKNHINETIRKLIDLYNTGLKPKGLGFKQLRHDLWEIRTSLRERILFSIDGDTIRLILIGNHDEIKRFLKNF